MFYQNKFSLSLFFHMFFFIDLRFRVDLSLYKSKFLHLLLWKVLSLCHITVNNITVWQFLKQSYMDFIFPDLFKTKIIPCIFSLFYYFLHLINKKNSAYPSTQSRIYVYGRVNNWSVFLSLLQFTYFGEHLPFISRRFFFVLFHSTFIFCEPFPLADLSFPLVKIFFFTFRGSVLLHFLSSSTFFAFLILLFFH